MKVIELNAEHLFFDAEVQRAFCGAAAWMGVNLSGQAHRSQPTLKNQGIEQVFALGMLLSRSGVESCVVAGSALWQLHPATDEEEEWWGYTNSSVGDWYPWLVLTHPETSRELIVDCATCLWPPTYAQLTRAEWPADYLPPEYVWGASDHPRCRYTVDPLATRAMRQVFDRHAARLSSHLEHILDQIRPVAMMHEMMQMLTNLARGGQPPEQPEEPGNDWTELDFE